MSKAYKFGKIGLFAGVLSHATINLINQVKAINSNPNLKFDWIAFFKSAGKGALVGGAVGTGVGFWKDVFNSKVKRKNTDFYLYNLAGQVRLDTMSPEFASANEKAKYLVKIITSRFARKLAGSPQRLGSTERGTALKRNFDIDLGFNFKAKSFSSTAAMRIRLIKFLETHIGRNSIVVVREQRNSIGVIFDVGSGRKCKIDVVPVKLSVGSKSSGFLSTDTGAFFGKSYTHRKTDFTILNTVKLSDTQKRIVVLLKHWKETKDIPIGSHLLESLVLDAYKYSSFIPKGFTKKVIMVLKHIANKLDIAVIRGRENSNNILTNIPEDRKAQIIQACKETIDEYDYQPNSVANMFS